MDAASVPFPAPQTEMDQRLTATRVLPGWPVRPPLGRAEPQRGEQSSCRWERKSAGRWPGSPKPPPVERWPAAWLEPRPGAVDVWTGRRAGKLQPEEAQPEEAQPEEAMYIGLGTLILIIILILLLT